MNLDKSKKRISKRVKMGFKGYPELSIAYFGSSADVAEKVVLAFIPEEGAKALEESFQCEGDAREDQVIQSAIVKMIERTEAKTVKQAEQVELLGG